MPGAILLSFEDMPGAKGVQFQQMSWGRSFNEHFYGSYESVGTNEELYIVV